MTTLHSPLAAIEHITDDLVVVRLKPDARLTTRGIQDLANEAGSRGTQPLSVMVIIPEDVDFDVAIMRVDHCTTERIKVMAIVSESSLFHGLVKLYLSYFPQYFPIRVFKQVEEGVRWLEEDQACGERA